jgi:glycosyltransferase involved in cell wall biosynthesis
MIQVKNPSTYQGLMVTIFIPVFNGEQYLSETLISIRNQTYSNFEVLLVDDSSSDRSKFILDKFAYEDHRFKVFVKKNGGMVSCSWNYIIPEISGDFVFYSSQDDLFSKDLIEKMVKKQQETQVDIILPDMEYYFEDRKINKRIVGFKGDRNDVLTGRNAFLASINWDIHGFALINKNLIIQEFFPEDAFDSDDFITRKIFLKSSKVVFCEGIFFYRQDNDKAITKTFSKKNFYSLNSALRLYNLITDNKFNKYEIVNVQFSLLLKYFQFTSIYQYYNFDSKSDKEEVKQFLINFRKNNFTTSFYLVNLNYAVINLKLRFVVLLFICKSSILLKIASTAYAKTVPQTTIF